MAANNLKIPGDDIYPIVNLLFNRKLRSASELNTESLTITCLDLISRGRIQVEIDPAIKDMEIKKHSIFKSKGNSDKELLIMEKMEFKIKSKNMKELIESDKIVLNMFKDINNNHSFNLKSMYEKMLKKEVAIKFSKHFQKYEKSILRETRYKKDSYKDIIVEGNFTLKGNELNNQWKLFKKDLKSKELYQNNKNNEDNEKNKDNENNENNNLFDKYLIYGRCFGIEKEIIKNIEKYNEYESQLFNFSRYDGADLLKLIFDKAMSNSKIERKGDGSIPMGNSKHFVPGFG